MAVKLAAAPTRAPSSAIRDLLAVTERPEVLSLAGGLPAPSSFPVDAIAAATAEVLATDGTGALQYAPTAGVEPLRRWICPAAPEQVVVTHGSQQALELLTRALVDPGDEIALADPAYIGALQVFRVAAARLVAVPADAEGMRVDVLADRLAAGASPRLVYVVADFDNPSGATLSFERRRALAELADRYGFVVVEDDPYGDLRWRGERLPHLAELTDRAVTLGTVSKVLAPGLRVGWAVAPPAIAAALVKLKQSADLQTATFNQHVVHRVVSTPGFLEPHLDRLRSIYEPQCRALAAALRAELGERISFTAPDGGMFLWARIAGVDARELLGRAVDHGVAFVPGVEFAVDRAAADPSTLRLSFATASPPELAEAARRLAAAVSSSPRSSPSSPSRPGAAIAASSRQPPPERNPHRTGGSNRRQQSTAAPSTQPPPNQGQQSPPERAKAGAGWGGDGRDGPATAAYRSGRRRRTRREPVAETSSNRPDASAGR